MTTKRTDYAYVAKRTHRHNDAIALPEGQFIITGPTSRAGVRQVYRMYGDGEMFNITHAELIPLLKGAGMYRECMKAVDRLLAEEGGEA